MDKITTTTFSEQQTQLFAYEVTKKYFKISKNIIFLLEGELGCGKTQFVKGVAKYLKINPKKVHSPTFVYITEYHNRKFIFYHLDFYRLKPEIISEIFNDHIEELWNLLQHTTKKVVSCIEWSQKILDSQIHKFIKWISKENLKDKFAILRINFSIKKNFSRKIVVTKL